MITKNDETHHKDEPDHGKHEKELSHGEHLPHRSPIKREFDALTGQPPMVPTTPANNVAAGSHSPVLAQDTRRRTTVRARPIVDLVIEGLEIAPHACLLDAGATAIRLGAHVAELCGIDTTKSLQTKLAVGGSLVTARMAMVSLQVTSIRTRTRGAHRSDSANHGAPHSDSSD